MTVTPGLIFGSATNNLGEVQDLTLDLFEPAGDAATERPVIVWAHGGSFTGGAKEDAFIVSLASRFARRGYVTASISYRIRPEGTPGSPTFVDLVVGSLAGSLPEAMLDAQHDMQAAVRWFRANAGTLRIDPSAIVVAGFSAGANMALETAFNPEDPGDSGSPGVPSDVAAAVSVSGGTDLRRIQTPPPPVVMFNGTHDTTAPYPVAIETCAGIILHSGVCSLTTYVQGEHDLSPQEADIVLRTAGFLCRHVVACG
ncbi:MAG: alpha/beta hydrolase [Chloroflexi bacterium]|nr:alpha/beta hydrolase [Chloroflexota bacterium]